MPQLEFHTFVPQLVWLAITFGFLYLMMARVALPRIANVLEERRDRIADDLDQAEQFKRQTDEAIAAYEKALADARANAHEIAQATRDKLNEETERQRKSIEARLAEKIAAAEKQIAATKDKALGNVRAVAIEVADAVVTEPSEVPTVPPPSARSTANSNRRTGTHVRVSDFWVLISFLMFIGLLVYYKVPGMIGGLLDKRAADIAAELDEARRLREEAQQLLASYQRKQREAMKEAEDIVAQAKVEAENLAREIRANMEAQVERRTKLAEDKIAQAESQALSEVRATAANVAIGAARKVIADKVTASEDEKLVERSIADLASKLH